MNRPLTFIFLVAICLSLVYSKPNPKYDRRDLSSMASEYIHMILYKQADWNELLHRGYGVAFTNNGYQPERYSHRLGKRNPQGGAAEFNKARMSR